MKQQSPRKVNPRTTPRQSPIETQVVLDNATESLGEAVVKLREVGQRLDQFLADRRPSLSRRALQAAIQAGQVSVDGSLSLKVHQRLALGQVVTWRFHEAAVKPLSDRSHLPLLPLPTPAVVAETDDLLVLNKPAGLSMHPVRKGQTGTLTDWLSTHYPQILAVGENPLRPGMVHRLDRDTSGVVVIAKTEDAFRALKRLFQERRVSKRYLALVYGQVADPSGVIEAPLGRLRGSIRRAVSGGKRAFGGALREATTVYALHTRYPQHDLLSVEPKTGRTHQIRVHLASLGHPVVGDRLYRFKEHRGDPLQPPHQLLHAAEIRFTLYGRKLRFEAPLPSYFADSLHILALQKDKGQIEEFSFGG